MSKASKSKYSISHDDLQLQRICDELSCSLTPTELSKNIQKIVVDIGFSHFMFIRLDAIWNTDLPEGILYSVPEELVRIYKEKQLYDSDLVLQYSAINTEAKYASSLYDYFDNAPFEIDLTSKNRAIIKLYKQFGFFNQLVIPIPAFNGKGHVLTLLMNRGAETDDSKYCVTSALSDGFTLCKAIDIVSTDLFCEAPIGETNRNDCITPKQLLVLDKLFNSDSSITKIAKDLRISTVTANQHVAAIRKALGVKTNIAAVVKAFRKGVIHMR